MEFIFFLSPLLFLVTISIIYIFIIYKTKTQEAANERLLPLPPGRRGWPLIGETLDYIAAVNKLAPHEFVTDRIKKYATKVFKTSLLGQPMAILPGAEGNQFLFNNEKKLVQVWYPGMIRNLFMESLWKNNHAGMIKARNLSAPLLQGGGLHKFVSTMDAAAREHFDLNWCHEEIKGALEVKNYITKMALSHFFGVNDPKMVEKISPLLATLGDGLISLPVNMPGTSYNRAIKASKLIAKETEGFIKQRKIDLSQKTTMTPPQDLLSLMLRATDENGAFLSEIDILSNLNGMMLASYDGLSGVMAFLMKYLAELPHVYDGVLREQMEIANSKEPGELLNWNDIRKMSYSWNVCCEVMRLRVGVGTFREALTDFTYNGYTIRKGWKMHWIPAVTHMDPEYFPNSEKFDPTRFDNNKQLPYSFVPFGGGPRMCPGNEYARVVMLIFMHNAVTRFKWELLSTPNEKIRDNPLTKFSEGLPVHVYRHKP